MTDQREWAVKLERPKLVQEAFDEWNDARRGPNAIAMHDYILALEADIVPPSSAEAVAWQPKYKLDVIDHMRSLGGFVWEYAMTIYPTKEGAQSHGMGDHEVRPLYTSPPASAEAVAKPLDLGITKAWFEKHAALEGDLKIGVGRRLTSTVNITEQEIAALEELALTALPKWAQDEIRRYRAETIVTTALEAEVTRLRGALKFYVDPTNYIDTPSWDGDPSCITEKAIPFIVEEGSTVIDCGDIARAALAESSDLKKRHVRRRRKDQPA